MATAKKGAGKPAERETSIRRGIEIMIALAGEETLAAGGLGVTRIAELLGREKSQISRALKVFHEHGFVERNEDGSYRLGWRLYALAHAAGEPRLIEEAAPLLRALAVSVGERAHLSVLQGTESLTLLSQSPGRGVEAVGWVGRLTPAYCTSAGRALLLNAEPQDIRRLFEDVEFAKLGPKTVRSPAQLSKRIAAARAQGYVVVDQEFEPDLIGLSVPVYAARDRIIASVNVSAPRYRVLDRLDEIAQALLTVGRELTNALGAGAGDPSASAAEARRKLLD